MKWFILALILIVAISIATGYMGGARDATNNYNKLLRPAK